MLIVEGNTIVNTDTQSTKDITSDYTATLIKDVDGKVIGIAFNNEDDEVVENIKIQTDTVINTDNCGDNMQSFINEVPTMSFMIPCVVALIAAFIVVLFNSYTKYKREKQLIQRKYSAFPYKNLSKLRLKALRRNTISLSNGE